MVPSSLNSDIYQAGYKLMDHKAEKHEAKGVALLDYYYYYYRQHLLKFKFWSITNSWKVTINVDRLQVNCTKPIQWL